MLRRGTYETVLALALPVAYSEEYCDKHRTGSLLATLQTRRVRRKLQDLREAQCGFGQQLCELHEVSQRSAIHQTR